MFKHEPNKENISMTIDSSQSHVQLWMEWLKDFVWFLYLNAWSEFYYNVFHFKKNLNSKNLLSHKVFANKSKLLTWMHEPKES